MSSPLHLKTFSFLNISNYQGSKHSAWFVKNFFIILIRQLDGQQRRDLKYRSQDLEIPNVVENCSVQTSTGVIMV